MRARSETDTDTCVGRHSKVWTRQINVIIHHRFPAYRYFLYDTGKLKIERKVIPVLPLHQAVRRSLGANILSRSITSVFFRCLET